VLLTPQLAGIARSDLGTEVTNIAERRDAVIAALDCLFTGILPDFGGSGAIQLRSPCD
jgi:toxin CcdB